MMKPKNVKNDRKATALLRSKHLKGKTLMILMIELKNQSKSTKTKERDRNQKKENKNQRESHQTNLKKEKDLMTTTKETTNRIATKKED
jgi:hypothetical protein